MPKGVEHRLPGQAEAFRRLQTTACDHNLELVEAARMILTAEEAYRPVDQ